MFVYRTAIAVGFVALLLAQGIRNPADAYPVGPSLELDKLSEQADLVFKAVAVASQPVEDAWFGKVWGYEPLATEMKILSVYKGKTDRDKIAFHHYAPSKEEMGVMYMPQYYKFESGRIYIVFAKATADDRVFRQIWKNHRMQEDQGVLLAATDDPHKGKTIKKVFWLELTGLLKSKQTDDVKYGLEHLDWMSGGHYDSLHDFEREAVLKTVQPLIAHRDPKTVRAAITVLGSRNPYLSPGSATFWLATVGNGHLPGLGKWDRNKEYLGGKLYWRQLADVADSQAPAETRALAIRALGRSGRPEVLTLVNRWVKDREPAICQAATVLLADFPDKADQELLTSLADDSRPAVRVGAAQAIGFGQFDGLVPVLGRLLDDASPAVAQAAAQSLLSFAPEHSRDVLQANIRDSQYRSLFINALAKEDPEPYLDQLCEILQKKLQPKHWWGGSIPWGVSWNILFRYAQRQPAEKLKSGDCDKVLDALECPGGGQQQGPRYFSSSEPRDLYALYVQRGLSGRAREFRAACKKSLSYDIDYYFKMVDEHPVLYQRR